MIDIRISLPDSFLEEEERDGYVVDAQMKEVWAVEMDLLQELLRVCSKYNLKICAYGGTLLGAVRHKGFIPWDDDIDMVMPRSDYEKLCEVGPEEFQEEYFFQTEYTDPGSMRGHAQLRNSKTTGVLPSERRRRDINQGIFIDIFVFDNVPESEEELAAQRKKALFYKKIAKRLYWHSDGYPYLKKSLRTHLCHGIFWLWEKILPYDKAYQKFEEACAMYNHRATKRMGILSFAFGLKDEARHCKDHRDYEELILLPFEHMEIPVPKEYEHSLDSEYGDWRKFVVGTSCHGSVLFDTDTDYKTFLQSYSF